MSRSNPTADPILNPSKRWFQWDSTTKSFKYYNKDLPHPTDPKKKGDNVSVPLPFQFMVLDVLTTVAGFSDEEQSSFYANEVRNYLGSTKAEVLSVKLKGKEVAHGTWEQIKEKVEALGAKFANSIYIGYFDENKQLQLGNIKLYGAPIGAWIEKSSELSKAGKKIEECAFKVVTTKAGKKGSVVWNEPVFEQIVTKSETDAKATELDKILQAFLEPYLKTNSSSVAAEVPVSEPEQPKTLEDMIPTGPEPVTAQNSGLPADFEDEAF
jgi:hypothetical protein